MTTPPDAHGADDSPMRPTGAVPFPDAPGTGAVPFPASPTGAVPFADQPGTAAPPFGDLPEMDAAPPLRPAGTHTPFPAPGYAPPWSGAPGTPPPNGQRRTGVAAIIALVTGLLGLVPVALLFGIGALVFRRRRNRAGKSFAVVGIAASLAWSAAAYLLLPVAAEALFSVERDESGEIRKAETTLFTLLRKGDCFTGYDFTEELQTVKAVPCAEPHTGEVILRTTLPDAPWPGDERVERAARVVCGSEIVRLRKSPRYPTLKPYYEVPNAVGWRLGRRQLICALHSDDELEGRLAGTVSKKVRPYEELARWNCIGKPVQGKHPHVSRVSCSKPHFAQVFATYEIEPDLGDHPLAYPAYPGPEVLEARVGNQCEALAVKTWPRPPGSGLQLFAIPPSPADWEVGIRTVVCTLTRPGEKLRGSLAPR